MTALVKTARGVGNVALLDVEVPKIGPHDVLVKVGAAGICGSDVLTLQDKLRIYKPPVILGHNVAGTVAELGSEVEGFAVGDRVAIDMNLGACGQCSYCRSKREYLCRGRKGMGNGMDGGMSNLLAVKDTWPVKVPAGLSLEEVAPMDVGNAIHAIMDRSDVRYGSSVVVYGPGFQGLSAVQVLKILGASPIIMVGRERHRQRLEMAKQMGADYVVANDSQDLKKLVNELTDGEGVDVVLEMSGAPASLAEAIEIVRKGGCVSLLGSLPEDTVVDMHRVIFDEIALNGVRGYNRDNVNFFLSALASGKLDVKQFVKTFPLAQWEEAFEARIQGKVIEPVLVP